MPADLHPLLNACLNATSAVLLYLGWRAIRRGQRARHRTLMIAAFASSSVFLASYLLRFAISGTTKYVGSGGDKVAYLVILFSHMVLAIAVVPMALRGLWLAHTQQFDRHRRLMRVAWPIWMYVSVTGVVVYLMLYHVGPALQ